MEKEVKSIDKKEKDTTSSSIVTTQEVYEFIKLKKELTFAELFEHYEGMVEKSVDIPTYFRFKINKLKYQGYIKINGDCITDNFKDTVDYVDSSVLNKHNQQYKKTERIIKAVKKTSTKPVCVFKSKSEQIKAELKAKQDKWKNRKKYTRQGIGIWKRQKTNDKNLHNLLPKKSFIDCKYEDEKDESTTP